MNTEEFLEQQKGNVIDAINETQNIEGLRDYFAAAAMQGLISATPEDNEFQSINSAARLAYLYADAMLKERERGE